MNGSWHQAFGSSDLQTSHVYAPRQFCQPSKIFWFHSITLNTYYVPLTLLTAEDKMINKTDVFPVLTFHYFEVWTMSYDTHTHALKLLSLISTVTLPKGQPHSWGWYTHTRKINQQTNNIWNDCFIFCSFVFPTRTLMSGTGYEYMTNKWLE